MTLFVAKKAFSENINLISPQSDPVAYNLNLGLRNLCEALQQAQNERKQTIQMLLQIQHQLQALNR